MSIPTIDAIKKAYDEIVTIIKDVNTIEQCKMIEKKYRVTIEINSHLIKEYEAYGFTDAHIETIRVEAYDMLGYIYFNKIDNTVYFDVWSDDLDAYFLMDTTIDTLETAYPNGVKWLQEHLGTTTEVPA